MRTALHTIDVEFENCRRAWAWSIAHGQVDALKRSPATLLEHFDYRGRFEEGAGISAHSDRIAARASRCEVALAAARAHIASRVPIGSIR